MLRMCSTGSKLMSVCAYAKYDRVWVVTGGRVGWLITPALRNLHRNELPVSEDGPAKGVGGQEQGARRGG